VAVLPVVVADREETGDPRLQEFAQVVARPVPAVAVGSLVAALAAVEVEDSADVREDLPQARAPVALQVEEAVLRSVGPEGAAGTPKSWSRAS
jgi:hypothetical protein